MPDIILQASAISSCVRQIQVLDTMIINKYNVSKESEVYSNMDFGEKLKLRRKEKKLTQEDMALFFGDDFNRQSVSKWERNDAYPEVDKLLVLSVKLDISLDELFSNELSYLKKKKPSDSVEDTNPGLVAGLKTLADILSRNK